MRDYLYEHEETGVLIPVSKMSDNDIARVLHDGFDAATPIDRECLTERLRIEQLIRILGL
jgi:hypothetical protein